MELTPAQLQQYDTHGYVLLHDVFNPDELAGLQAHATEDLATDSPRRTREANSGLVRATHGAHLEKAFFRDVVRMPRLLDLAEQIVGSGVYVHQFKINAKAALGGELWEWHQDSFFWLHEDGMEKPGAVNVLIHLDEVTEFNGPLLVIPGSHRKGEIEAKQAGGGGEDWRETVSARLKYTLDEQTLRALVDEHGIEPVKGPPGTVLVFHPAIVHGSSGNMSPYARRLLILSYNSCDNALAEVAQPRPEFLAARDFTPLDRLPHGDLPRYTPGAPVPDVALGTLA
jgi:ectoine hydroxylase